VHNSKSLGVDGVVFGLLKKDGSIDIEKTRELVSLAQPLQITFHRAIDISSNIFNSLEQIISIGGIQRILTSGGEQTCLEGLDNLKKLVEIAKDRIIIVCGGGINERNVGKIISISGCTEFHSTARESFSSQMEYRNNNISIGGQLKQSEYQYSKSTSNKIQNLLKNASLQ